MKKLILSAVAVCFLAACATDPYTGESKVSKTAWGTGIGTLAGAGIGALVGGEKGVHTQRRCNLSSGRRQYYRFCLCHPFGCGQQNGGRQNQRSHSPH